MQYQDTRKASSARAILRIIFAFLAILSLLAIFSEDPAMLRMRLPLLALLAISFSLAAVGGLCEVSISADDDYIDIRCQQILFPKGSDRVYSIGAGRLISWHKVSILFLHYVYIDYIGHNSHHRHVCVGLTLVPSRVRHDLYDHLHKILKFQENDR